MCKSEAGLTVITIRRSVIFLALLILFVIAARWRNMPLDFYGGPRLLAIFVIGTVLLLFVEGPTFGLFPPVSTRPLMILLGLVLMGTSVLWLFALTSVMRK